MTLCYLSDFTEIETPVTLTGCLCLGSDTEYFYIMPNALLQKDVPVENQMNNVDKATACIAVYFYVHCDSGNYTILDCK